MSLLLDTRAQPGEPGTLGTLIRGTRSRKRPWSEVIRLLNPAWLCVIAGLGLSLVGVYAIDLADTAGAGPDLAPVAWKQLVFVIVGLIAATLIALPHHRMVGWLAWPAFIGVIGLLVFLLIPAVPASLVTPRNGTRGWIDFGPLDLQPAELGKIAYVLVVAEYMRYRSSHRTLAGLIVPAAITAVPVALITLQPDLGTAALFVPSLGAMLIAAGAKLRHFALIFVVGALAAPLCYPLLRDHQRARIDGLIMQFQGDTSSAQDLNYQAFTAQNLIGAGRGNGMPEEAARPLVRYNGLPERHNDTIFAVIIARFGFLGGLGLMGLYVLWIVGALATAGICREPQAKLIGVGFAAFIAAQLVVNIGMNIGLLPIIGITLPFVSYGGSSLLTVWLMTGLVLNTGIHRPLPPFRQSFEYAE